MIKMSMRIGIILKTCLLVIFSTSVQAIDPRLEWKTLETENFYIHFADGYQKYANRVADIARRTHQQLQPVIDWQPLEKTHLILSDHTDFANGYATPNHFNRSVLFLAPPDTATGIEDYDDWLTTLIVHEYVHILHLDKSHGLAALMRDIFGRHFLLFPNALQPGWLIEGLATYHETDRNAGIGRGQSSLFESMMRAELEQGLKPVSQANLTIRSWPMGGVAYLYGVYFYEFMVETYGYEKVEALIRQYSDNIIPFSINSNANEILEKDITALWVDFEAYLHKRFYAAQVADTAQTNNGLALTATGYHTDQYGLMEDGRLYYIKDQVYEHASLNVIEGGNDRKLLDVNSRSRLDVHPEHGVIILQADFCDEYNINYDVFTYDNGELEKITDCGRYRSATWSADGKHIIAVKLVKGESWLVRLTKQGEIDEVLWRAMNDEVISQIKHSPAEEKIIAAVHRKGEGWNIEEFDMQSLQWQNITDDAHLDMYPSYSQDGQSVLFSSDRNSGYQVFRFNKKSKVIEQISNVSYAAFSPLQLNDDSPLYYVGYHINGRDIFKLEEPLEEPVVTQKIENIADQSKQVINNQEPYSVDYKYREYSAVESMRPRWWFPSIQIDEEKTELGFVSAAHDALAIHSYSMNLRYDTVNDWFSGGASYIYRNRFVIGYQRTTDVIVDQQDEFALSREQDDIFASLLLNYPGYEEFYQVQLGVLLSKEKDGERADTISAFPELRDNLLGVSFNYGSTNHYVRSISESDGAKIRLTAETSELNNSDFSGEVYTLDWKQFVALGNQHVLAVRFVQGWGTEQPERFRLGGELNDYNLLDLLEPIGEPLLGKRKYSLRGYKEGLRELRGRRMQLATIEWRFPGQLIERGWMSPPLGLIQWSGKLFAESGAAYETTSADKYYSSLGLELAADVNLFYGINSRMRLGYARGLDEQLGDDRIYFSLGSSF